MPSRLSGYIEKLYLLRNFYTYALHMYATIKIYRYSSSSSSDLNSSNVSTFVSPVGTLSYGKYC